MAFRLFRQLTRIQMLMFMVFSLLVIVDIISHREPHSSETIRQIEEFTISGIDEPVEDVSEMLPISFQRSQSNKSTLKFRKMAPQDFPPEARTDWIKPEKEIPVFRFPNCLLVGFSKCGTSSLLRFLNVHPEIVSLDWETDYFCDRVYFKYSLHWYRMRMPQSMSNQVTIEKSPCYISQSQALERIHAFNSSMKIMVILRDPITRIISQHGQYLNSFKSIGQRQMSLEERYINKKTGGLQEGPVKKWGIFTSRLEKLFTIFPREQIHVVDGDYFVVDPLRVLSKIERFLGVKNYFSDKDVYYDAAKGFFCPRNRSSRQVECMSNQKGRRHVQMSPKLRRALKEHLRPYAERLFDLIGFKMNWDLEIDD